MAEATELMTTLKFSGKKETGCLQAEEFIRTIEARMKKLNWDEPKTMDNVVAALSGEAAEWFHVSLPNQLEAEQRKTLRTNYTNSFLPAFKLRFRVTSTNKYSRQVDISPQKSSESMEAFIDRITGALFWLSFIKDKEMGTLEPLPNNVQEKLDTEAARNAVIARAKKIYTDTRRDTFDEYTGEICKNVIVNGLSHPVLRAMAWDKVETESLAGLIRVLQTTNARLDKEKSKTKAVANEVKEEDMSEQEEVDKVSSNPKKGNNSKKNYNKDDKGKPNSDKADSATKVSKCKFCKKPGHTMGKCWKKQAAMAILEAQNNKTGQSSSKDNEPVSSVVSKNEEGAWRF